MFDLGHFYWIGTGLLSEDLTVTWVPSLIRSEAAYRDRVLELERQKSQVNADSLRIQQSRMQLDEEKTTVEGDLKRAHARMTEIQQSHNLEQQQLHAHIKHLEEELRKCQSAMGELRSWVHSSVPTYTPVGYFDPTHPLRMP